MTRQSCISTQALLPATQKQSWACRVLPFSLQDQSAFLKLCRTVPLFPQVTLGTAERSAQCHSWSLSSPQGTATLDATHPHGMYDGALTLTVSVPRPWAKHRLLSTSGNFRFSLTTIGSCSSVWWMSLVGSTLRTLAGYARFTA